MQGLSFITPSEDLEEGGASDLTISKILIIQKLSTAESLFFTQLLRDSSIFSKAELTYFALVSAKIARDLLEDRFDLIYFLPIRVSKGFSPRRIDCF